MKIQFSLIYNTSVSFFCFTIRITIFVSITIRITIFVSCMIIIREKGERFNLVLSNMYENKDRKIRNI